MMGVSRAYWTVMEAVGVKSPTTSGIMRAALRAGRVAAARGSGADRA